MLQSPDTVDVWRIDLDDHWDGWFHSLSPDERERAERYATPVLARRFRAGRAALRWLLGEHCGVDPARIAFSANRYGKPQLAWPLLTSVHFNISHTGRHALIALGPRALGIDIEAVRADRALGELLELACDREERRLLAAMAEPQRSLEFYRLWTRKEAYCKAIGSGLQKALDTVSFARVPLIEARQVLEAGMPQPGWIVRDLAAPAGCVASLCLLDGEPANTRMHVLTIEVRRASVESGG